MAEMPFSQSRDAKSHEHGLHIPQMDKLLLLAPRAEFFNVLGCSPLPSPLTPRLVSFLSILPQKVIKVHQVLCCAHPSIATHIAHVLSKKQGKQVSIAGVYAGKLLNDSASLLRSELLLLHPW